MHTYRLSGFGLFNLCLSFNLVCWLHLPWLSSTIRVGIHKNTSKPYTTQLINAPGLQPNLNYCPMIEENWKIFWGFNNWIELLARLTNRNNYIQVFKNLEIDKILATDKFWEFSLANK